MRRILTIVQMSLLVFAGCTSDHPNAHQPSVVRELALEDLKSDAREDCAESGGQNACACEWARRGTKVPSDLYGESWCDWLKEEDNQ